MFEDVDNLHLDSSGVWYLYELEIEEILKREKARDVIAELTKPSVIEELEPVRKGEPMADYFSGRLTHLRLTINQLMAEMVGRRQLKEDFIEKIDYQITKAAFSLSELWNWGIGYNTGVDVKRNFLERQLAQFRKERREAELRAWEDIIALRKDLREALAEYQELKRRAGIFEYLR